MGEIDAGRHKADAQRADKAELRAEDWLSERDTDGTFKLKRPTIGDYCLAMDELRSTRDTLLATGAAPLLARRLSVFLERKSR